MIVRDYIRNFDIFFSITKAIMLSVLFGAVLFILDFYNLLTQLFDLTSPVILMVV